MKTPHYADFKYQTQQLMPSAVEERNVLRRIKTYVLPKMHLSDRVYHKSPILHRKHHKEFA